MLEALDAVDLHMVIDALFAGLDDVVRALG